MEPQKSYFLREVRRRNPFAIEHLPFLVRVYRYPFQRWSTHGKQALFGVFNIGAFMAYQKLVPLRLKGSFLIDVQGVKRRVVFDGRNTQFESLYLDLYSDGYESEVTALIDVLLDNKGVFYDVGSNWGYLSVWAATKPGFNGQVHAFEPFPSTFRDLENVVQQSGLLDKIHLHQVAVADTEGTASMYIPDMLHSGWATIGGSNQHHDGGVPTRVTTLDAVKLDAPTVIKIDAERAEARVIRGGASLIAETKPFIVFESFRDTSDPFGTLEPFHLLHKANYKFFRPAWLRAPLDNPHFVDSNTRMTVPAIDHLALVPFNLEERFLCPDLLNVFACHAERLAELTAYFEQKNL